MVLSTISIVCWLTSKDSKKSDEGTDLAVIGADCAIDSVDYLLEINSEESKSSVSESSSCTDI